MRKENFFGYDSYTFGTDTLEVCIISLGAIVKSIKYKGQETVLNYPDGRSYSESSGYLCAAIGRFANRIGGAHFQLNNKDYFLTKNEGENQLHGGPSSFNMRVWNAQVISEHAVRFTLFSPDGDNGFPGNLTAGVVYTVEGSTLHITFEGVCDADTIYAPTSHLYFRLDESKNALEHELCLHSDGWLEVDEALIPTGRILPATGDFDFSSLRRVKRDYDHCFTLDQEHACTVQAGKIRLDLFTDFPALQIYTASAMGEPLGKNAGLAIEPELYPDSPNHPQFPSAILREGEQFRRYASFVYSDC